MAESRSAVWPGRPYPLGATWDGVGVNFALFSEHAQGVELCLFDPTGPAGAGAGRAARADRPGLARLPARRPPRPALRLPRARALRARAGPPVQSAQAPARPVRQGDPGGHCAGPTPMFGYRIGNPRRGPVASTIATTPPACPSAGSSTRASTGATTGRRAPPGTRRSSTSCTCRGFTCLHPEVPEPLRGTYAGLATAPVIDYLQPPRRHRGRAAAGASASSTTAIWSSRGCATTGATTPSASSRPTRAIAAGRAASREFKRMVQDPARRRHRGHPRRGLQPHGRGQPAGPDPVASAASTTPPTTASHRASPAITWTTPAAATPST